MGQVSKSFNHIIDSQEINELSVVLYADSFFYGLWGKDDRLLRSDSHHLSNFGKMLKIWNNNYDLQMVRVLSLLKPFTHLHEDHYQQDYFDDYFAKIYDIRKLGEVNKETDSFLNENIKTLHYIDQKWVSELTQFDFPFKISHISTALANFAFLKEKPFIAFVEEGLIHLCFIDKKGFKFYNQFYCLNRNDYLYFIQLIMHVFEQNAHETPICIGGTITKESPLFTFLKGYLPKMELINDQIRLTKELDKPLQLYFDLYLSKACV